jgi:hypothetical protein
MNLYTKLIARFLKVDFDTALKVQNYIDEHDLIDWSEASEGLIRRTAILAYDQWRLTSWAS